jgi:predicted dehydrogenase
MKPIGAAIIGTGFMGGAHAEALLRAGIPIAGILGSTPHKSRQAADRLALARGYETYQQVLDDPAVASVHLCVPNKLHLTMATEALAAGKHVMCEKPLAMDLAEARQLVAVAAKHPRLAAAVNYNVRFYPLCLEARQMAAAGTLGKIFHVCGSYVQDWLLHDTDYNWRVLAEEGGALRAVADIGTHWLDLMATITGLEVEAVCADLATVHPVRRRPRGEIETFKGAPGAGQTEPIDISTDDYGCVMLRYAGGARGCLWVSQVTAGRKNCLRFEIAGSRQSLAWDSERPNEIWIGHRDGPNQSLLRDPSLLSPAARWAADYPGGHNEGYADTFKQCFRAFYGYIAAGDFGGEPPFPTFADGLREIALCEAILRSHKRGGWVDIKGKGDRT